MIVSKVLRTANSEPKNWKQELCKFLRNYRATPHTTTGKSLAERMFPNREFKTRIPDFIDNKDKVRKEDIPKKNAYEKEKIEFYADKRNNVKPCKVSRQSYC